MATTYTIQTRTTFSKLELMLEALSKYLPLGRQDTIPNSNELILGSRWDAIYTIIHELAEDEVVISESPAA